MVGPDTNTHAPPYPIWGFGPPAPEPHTKNLDALLASLNGSAARFQTLWLWFIGVTAYLAFLVLGASPRKLLLDQPIDLTGLAKASPVPISAPLEFLSSNLSIVMATIYVNLHSFIFLLFMPMITTANLFEDELLTVFPSRIDQDRFRARIENAFFLQVLVGAKGEPSTILLGIISFVTIVILPILTLILMQMVFLPFHSFRITWWLRGVVVVDVVLVLTMTWRFFFPRGVREAPLVLGSLRRKPRWAAAVALCVLLAIVLAPLVDWLSFQQGRWAGEPRPSYLKEWARWMAGQPPQLPEANPDYAATKDGVVFGLFPDRLLLRGETIVGDDLLERTKKEIALRGGDFVPTIKLDGRDFQAANLSGADLRGVSLSTAVLRGADLQDARLDGADLSQAQLQGADLSFAHLQGANLGEALLQGADFVGTQSQGANLHGAHLQGANLGEALLQGANFRGAHLRSANLGEALLQGADFVGAQLQGANLNGAQLQGANLRQTQLAGANLWRAQLQGANLSGADLTESAFNETFVFLTYIADANLARAVFRSVHSDPVKLSAKGDVEPLKRPDDVEGWITAATQFAGEEEKEDIAEQFARLKPDFRESVQEATWSGIQEASLTLDPDGAQHRQRLERLFGDLACNAGTAPYVARGLIENRRLNALRDQLAAFLARMKEGRVTPEKCPGVAGFTEEDWRKLDAIVPAESAPADR